MRRVLAGVAYSRPSESTELRYFHFKRTSANYSSTNITDKKKKLSIKKKSSSGENIAKLGRDEPRKIKFHDP